MDEHANDLEQASELETLEVIDDDPGTDDLRPDSEVTPVSMDPGSTDLFAREVHQFSLLTRPEEEALGKAITVARDRVRRLLRSRPMAVTRALAHAGRGVVHPDEDFREREALLILSYVRKHEKRRAHRCDTPSRRSFARTLERELTAYRILRDRMMTANIRLVMSLARRYHHPTLSFLDLVQEGMFGLLRAVEKYEPSREIKFSTYAAWWIWQQMSRAADYQGAMIRTPVHWNQFRRRMGRTNAVELAGTQAEEDEQGDVCGVPMARAAAMSQSFQCLSLTAPLAEGDDRTIGDTLSNEGEHLPEGAMLEADLARRLAGAVGELPVREAEILRMRFGLDGDEPVTLEDIGVRFGVSRERIRQLEARALKRMRAICDQRGLGEFLN